MKNKYSTTQIILGLIHLLLPVFLAIFLQNGEIFNDYSFISLIAISCIPIVLIGVYFFSDSSKLVKTGRSFKTKSGFKIDEYEEKIQKGIELPELHLTISLIHIAYPILIFIIWILSSSKEPNVHPKPNVSIQEPVKEIVYKGNGVFNSIKEAALYPEKVKELKIGFGSHQIIPLAVRKMKNLELLQMEYNQLQGIPEWIEELQNLKKIDLHKNNIKKVPRNLFKLKKLQELNLSQNKILEIPEGLEQLTNLKSLYLSENPINRKNAIIITNSLPNTNIYGLDKNIKNSFTVIEPGGEANFNKSWRSVQIEENKKWGVIDKNGNIIIPFEYDNMIRFDKDANSNKWYSLAVKNGKCGVIDTQNNLLIDIKYAVLWPFYGDGYAPCKKNKNDKFGLIDINENVIVDFKYDGLHHVEKGYVAAKLNGLWGYIDLNENVIVDFKYKHTTKLFDLGRKELKMKTKQ